MGRQQGACGAGAGRTAVELGEAGGGASGPQADFVVKRAAGQQG